MTHDESGMTTYKPCYGCTKPLNEPTLYLTRYCTQCLREMVAWIKEARKK